MLLASDVSVTLLVSSNWTSRYLGPQTKGGTTIPAQRRGSQAQQNMLYQVKLRTNLLTSDIH